MPCEPCSVASRTAQVCTLGASGAARVAEPSRRGGRSPEGRHVGEFWHTVRIALESNAKTVRLCVILIVLAAAVALAAL